MPKKNTSGEAPKNSGLNRRDFVKAGATGAAILAPGAVAAQTLDAQAPQAWDYEADVVVIGAGACGLTAAIRARDLGASVIIVEQNFDVGGKMLASGAWVSLGGGDPAQVRDIAGDSDREGFITAPRQNSVEELTDTPDLLFTDLTDWSVTDAGAQGPYRYNDRGLHRAHADNCAATRSFLMENYVRVSRVSGTHGNGGLSRARRATCFLIEGEKTDIKAGTVAREDAGIPGKSTSHFAPGVMADGTRYVRPGARTNGAALARPLEFSAREKGVRFILNHHMDEIIREKPFSGRVLGIRSSYSPRLNPKTGARLESYWKNGNVDDRKETISIRARKAIIVGAGGHGANPEFRQMFYPAWREPAFTSSVHALLGPRGQDASGIIAGLRVGATLAGMQQNIGARGVFHFPAAIGVRDAYAQMFPGHPTFAFRESAGIDLTADEFKHLIVVNQVGKRFFNEMRVTHLAGGAEFPGGPSKGIPKGGVDHVPLDWRNASAENVRAHYANYGGLHAAMAMNEGSSAPDYLSGPIWVIFDAEAVKRAGWNIGAPYMSPTNGCFFSANSIEELSAKIKAGNEFQRVPLTHLAATVAQWNSYAEKGSDPEFGRGADAPMYKIENGPFYAASLFPVWHDSYGGLRINGEGRVIDLEGKVIPGLFAGGESSGGGQQHGLGRCIVQGFIAGTNCVKEI